MERHERNTPLATAQDLMLAFAEDTGLLSDRAPRRYLWTDAFAVCNFLELHRQTQEQRFQDLALRLVDQVHHVLGRHREDDPRGGWISGLDEQEGEKHPTLGGLRIGKQLNERPPGEPYDETLEWDRDGQYYHYLTKWMHALHQVSRATGDATYLRWAAELAQTAHARFTYPPAAGRRGRMVWKMSINLSYPLVDSMGQHDPLDGLITYHELHAAAQDAAAADLPDLDTEIDTLAAICTGRRWATADPLGLGGLLSDAYRVAQLTLRGEMAGGDLLHTVLSAAVTGLQSFARQKTLELPFPYRLAFRELGLSIGLHAVDRLVPAAEAHPDSFDRDHPIAGQIAALSPFLLLREVIEQFWLRRASQNASSWTGHRDINMVMLATSLMPEGFLTL
jgi:hypothetical protein